MTRIQVYLLVLCSMVSSHYGESIVKLIINDGYSVETHYVVTSDGYILQMHHILPKIKQNNYYSKKVVFIMHDFLCSSADFVTSGPGNALAYYLVDNNYDVWLGNARGNNYSRQHLTLDPEPYNSTFWAFDWHEIGYYDLPAMIDHILCATGQSKLYYIGHSEGATAFFVMASMLPQYNEKISGMSALSPVVFLSHVPFVLLREESEYLLDDPILDYEVRNLEFVPDDLFFDFLGQDQCLNTTIPEAQGICDNIYILFSEYSTANINLPRLNVILNHNPSTTSANTFLHYGQCVLTGKFGELGPDNSTGADYDLKLVKTKIALFYTTNDTIVSEIDVFKLKYHLKNSNVNLHKIQNSQFTHSDFLYASNAIDLVYKKILCEMEYYYCD